MIRLSKLAAALAFMVLAPFAAAQERSQYQYWLELEAADQAYGDRAAEIGRTAAFLEFLNEDTVVFRRGPVSALEEYSDAPQERDEFTWESHYIDVSRSGDLGLTAGPYVLGHDETDQPDDYGHLISVWAKRSGRWELMADMIAPVPGVLSLQVEPDFNDTNPVLDEAAHPVLALGEPHTMQSLIEADNNFGRNINFRGAQRALLRFGLENTRVYLEDYGPAVGVEAASAIYGAYLDLRLQTTNPINVTFMGGGLSDSREMGYTYGTMVSTDDESGAAFRTGYLRLWRLSTDNEWRIAVEVLRTFDSLAAADSAAGEPP